MQDQQHHGKTALSIELAKKVQGEIISADSMQIYQDMDIGSAKPTLEEMQKIPHHMINIVEPKHRFSVAEYQKQAIKAIKEVVAKGKMPIVVGGTGLYINSLIYEIEYPDTKIDQDLREVLEQRAEKEGLEVLYQEAYQIDETAMKQISKNDKKRIIRVLEIYHQTGKTKTQLEKESRKKEVEFDYYLFITNLEREKLYERINKRVEKMVEQGLIEEVKEILRKYKEYPTAMQGLGYKETKEYLEGKITKEEMVEKIKRETRRYAKRQLTWFRKNQEAIWLDMSKSKDETIEQMMKIVIG